MARIYRVPRSFIADVWHSVEDYVARAMEYHPFMGADDVRALLDHDLLTLFIATENGVVVGFGALEVVQYPRRRVANILASGGKRGFLATAINELLPEMIAHGKDQGASFVTLSGRPGWMRALRHIGRSQPFVTWWADINEQGWRKLPAANIHARTVEAGTAVS